MKYQIGKPGRIIVARFDDHDDVLGNLISIAKKENIRAGVCYLVGGMREGKIVVGPETDKLPPKPVWKNLVKVMKFSAWVQFSGMMMNRKYTFTEPSGKKIW
jgi:predicted DNA-binding protein with PD1-like motif